MEQRQTSPTRSSEQSLPITVRQGVAGRVVIGLHGEPDLGIADQLRDALTKAARPADVTHVIIDFADVTFVDSTIIAVIVKAYRRETVLGKTLQIRGAHGLPLRVLTTMGLLPILGAGEAP